MCVCILYTIQSYSYLYWTEIFEIFIFCFVFALIFAEWFYRSIFSQSKIKILNDFCSVRSNIHYYSYYLLVVFQNDVWCSLSVCCFWSRDNFCFIFSSPLHNISDHLLYQHQNRFFFPSVLYFFVSVFHFFFSFKYLTKKEFYRMFCDWEDG